MLQVVERDVLCAEQVALAVGRALKSPPDQGHMVNMDGAARSAALLLEAVQGKK